MSLEHLVVPDSKEMLKKETDIGAILKEAPLDHCPDPDQVEPQNK